MATADPLTYQPPKPFCGYFSPEVSPLVEVSKKFSQDRNWHIAQVSGEAVIHQAFVRLLDTHECNFCRKQRTVETDENEDASDTEPVDEGREAEVEVEADATPPAPPVCSGEIPRVPSPSDFQSVNEVSSESQPVEPSQGGEPNLTPHEATEEKAAEREVGTAVKGIIRHNSRLDRFRIQLERFTEGQTGTPADSELVAFVGKARMVRLTRYSKSYFASCLTKKSQDAAISIGLIVFSFFKPNTFKSAVKAMQWSCGCALVANQCFALREYVQTPSVRARSERNKKFEEFCGLQVIRQAEVIEPFFYETKFNKIRRRFKISEVDLSTHIHAYLVKYKSRAETQAAKSESIRWAKEKFEQCLRWEIKKNEIRATYRELSKRVEEKEASLKQAKEYGRRAAREYGTRLAASRLPESSGTAVIRRDWRDSRIDRLQEELEELRRKQLSLDGQFEAKKTELRSELSHFKTAVTLIPPQEKVAYRKFVEPYFILLQYGRLDNKLKSDKKFNQAKIDLERAGLDDLLINGFNQSSMENAIFRYEKRKSEIALGIEEEFEFPDVPETLSSEQNPSSSSDDGPIDDTQPLTV